MKGKGLHGSLWVFIFVSVFKNPFDVIDEEFEVNDSKFEIPLETEQALKKIAKRGHETRTKGFRELVQSFKSLPKEHLAEISVLLRSTFVSIFNKYIFEPEKNNRAALGEVLRLLVTASDLKNFLAPIMKDILFNWLLAMYDSVAEVSAVYRRVFEFAFPGAGAVVKVLERFKDNIIEQVMQYLRGEKWPSINEISFQVMGANEEEAAFVVELVKTELVGLLHLLNAKNMIKLDEVYYGLLMQDNSYSAPRRLALYRLYKATTSAKLRPKIVKLVSSESNPSCLVFCIELLDDLKECYTEEFMLSIFANLPEVSFAKLVKVPINSTTSVLNAIVKFVAHGSSTISRERFDCIWTGFVAETLLLFATEDTVEKLLFDEKREFRTIGQLNAQETVKRLVSALPKDYIIKALGSKSATCQKVLILSELKLQDELNDCLNRLSLKELKRPEIMPFVSKEHILKSISASKVSILDFVDILESLDAESASQLIKENASFSFEDVLPVSSKNLIKNVLLKNNRKLKIVINAETVAAALESELQVFESAEIDESALNEALTLGHPHWNSPLVLELVKAKRIPDFYMIDQANLLLDRLDISPELFVHYRLDDEAYFPIDAFKCPTEEDSDISRILLFKSRLVADPLLQSLSKFPLRKVENVSIMATWCLLHGVAYETLVRSVPTSCNDWVNFALFKAGVPDFESITPLSSALAIYRSMQSKTVSEVNHCFDALLFPGEEAAGTMSPLTVLQSVSCIETLLPLKSDKLAALIDGSDFSLLLVALHSRRSDLSREFWRCQWTEKLKAAITSQRANLFSREVALKAAVSLWNVLEAPEREILPTFRQELLQLTEIDSNSTFEQSSLSQLFVLAAPFLELGKDSLIANFVDAASLPCLLSLRGALLMFVMDESLVAAQTKLSLEPNLLEEDCGAVIFPLFSSFTTGHVTRGKVLILLELFVSWCEGGKEDSLLQTAFHNVFKAKLFYVARSALNCDVFQEAFDFTPREFEADELAAHLVYRLCAQFPLIMAASCQDVECAAKLSAREIDRIRRCSSTTSENVTIKLKPVLTSTTRAINLSVNFAGEIDLELLLQLPRLFPLEPIVVEGVKRSGLKETKWKSALMSLQAIFRSSSFDGNILDAIRKWQANALKLFQGLEECAVCYSVVHPSDRSLPGPSCKQCKHRFHASCLYKWFKSSGNATCPLCRALF